MSDETLPGAGPVDEPVGPCCDAPAITTFLEGDRMCMHCGKHWDSPEDVTRAQWALGDYDNDQTGCPNCGRFRLCLCPNGKHRCEKCNWSPELNDYAPRND